MSERVYLPPWAAEVYFSIKSPEGRLDFAKSYKRALGSAYHAKPTILERIWLALTSPS